MYYGEGIFLTLCMCFHPETSFVPNLWLCNGNTKGTIVFHNCRLDFSVNFIIHMRMLYALAKKKLCEIKRGRGFNAN